MDAHLPSLLWTVIDCLRVGQAIPGKPVEARLIRAAGQRRCKELLGLKNSVAHVTASDVQLVARWNSGHNRLNGIGSWDLGRRDRVTKESELIDERLKTVRLQPGFPRA